MKTRSQSGISPDAARGLGTANAAAYTGLSVSFLEKARVNQTETLLPNCVIDGGAYGRTK